MRAHVLLLHTVWLIFLFPLLAGANGGPIQWSQVGPAGGVVPKQESTIRLQSEILHIRLHDDQLRYTVTAKYVLNNPGQSRSVLYGVPITWEAKRPAQIVSKDIILNLNGDNQVCRVVDISRGANPNVTGSICSRISMVKMALINGGRLGVLRTCLFLEGEAAI